MMVKNVLKFLILVMNVKFQIFSYSFYILQLMLLDQHVNLLILINLIH